MSERINVTVRDNPEASRYEAVTDEGAVAGYTAYARSPGHLVLVHTEVDTAYEGRGVGSTLAREVLDRLRGTDLQVTVVCPFIVTFIERHPEYQGVVGG